MAIVRPRASGLTSIPLFFAACFAFWVGQRGGRSDRENPRGGGGVRNSCGGGASFRARAVRGPMPAKSRSDHARAQAPLWAARSAAASAPSTGVESVPAFTPRTQVTNSPGELWSHATCFGRARPGGGDDAKTGHVFSANQY